MILILSNRGGSRQNVYSFNIFRLFYIDYSMFTNLIVHLSYEGYIKFNCSEIILFLDGSDSWNILSKSLVSVIGGQFKKLTIINVVDFAFRRVTYFIVINRGVCQWKFLFCLVGLSYF